VNYIVLNNDQARILSESTDLVELRDQGGRHLGFVSPGFTEEEIVVAKQRLDSSEPRYSTQEVLDHLRSLEQR